MDPRSEYAARLAARTATADAAASLVTRISNLRLAVFGALVAIVVALAATDVTPHLLWLPLAAFIVLVLRHAHYASVEREARSAARLYEHGLMRLDGTWAGHGRQGDGLVPAGHPNAGDLDLFGPGSVFELICAARTRVGEERLASWLLEPAAPDVVRARQAAARELAPRLDWREQLALAEGHARSAVERGVAAAWARMPRRLSGHGLRLAHGALALASTATLVGWLAFGWKPLWMVIAFVLQFVLASLERAHVHAVLEAADRPAQDLALAAHILEHLESSTFEAPHLQVQLARLDADGTPPSRHIRQLVRLMDLVDARRNQIFLPLSWLFSLGTQLAHAIEVWRARNGPHLGAWLDAVAEIEALASLATYAFEQPADAFPEIVAAPAFDAKALGHPLLPATRNVRNDVSLALERPAPQALLVSGSNMSGKSTLLRSVGVAAVMAFAGAPVRASSLRISPLAVGASIQLHDSLQEGASRFYAEIERLRQVVDISRERPPALFLLDEILHGTNSHDRRIGAAGVVRSLLDAGALGLVTTHDLALAAITDDSGGAIVNMHFEDQVEGERIAFDYTLRPGVVTRGNALALMRMVGLDVDDDTTPAPERAEPRISDSAEDAGI